MAVIVDERGAFHLMVNTQEDQRAGSIIQRAGSGIIFKGIPMVTYFLQLDPHLIIFPEPP
jgi:hypothetical protein